MEWSQLSTGFHGKTVGLDQVMSMDGQDRSNVATANRVFVFTDTICNRVSKRVTCLFIIFRCAFSKFDVLGEDC